MAANDMLSMNVEALRNNINDFSNSLDMLSSINSKFDECISILTDSWTTPGGKEVIGRLRVFHDDFESYLKNNLENKKKNLLDTVPSIESILDAGRN